MCVCVCVCVRVCFSSLFNLLMCRLSHTHIPQATQQTAQAWLCRPLNSVSYCKRQRACKLLSGKFKELKMFLNSRKVAYIFISTKYCCCSLHFSIVSRSHKAEKTILCSPLCIFFFAAENGSGHRRKNTSGYKCENCAKNVAYFSGDCCSCCCLPPHFVALSFCCTTIKTSCHLTVLSVDFPLLERDVKYAQFQFISQFPLVTDFNHNLFV